MCPVRRQPPETSGSGDSPFWGRRFRGRAALAWAPAKINLFLEVHSERPDGYHGIETLMLAVDLFDLLEITKIDEPAVGLQSTDPGLGTGQDNLIVQAATHLHHRYQPDAGAYVRLTKKIPMAAGLGGGSSDAATTLLALNALWEINAPTSELAEVAAKLGSDVPFFLTPPAGWCTGRGEVVEAEAVGGSFDIVIVKPPVSCSTAEVYRNVTVPEKPVKGDAIRKALRNGNVEDIGRALHNRLQDAALKLAPEIAAVLNCIEAEKPAGVQMSGSGSACFALCRDRREAFRVAEAVRETSPAGVGPEQVFVVRSWPTTA